ncbi:MAG: hypothetical protein ACXW5U_25545 [Thermoanaerobaculia bacterium]
MSSNSAMQLLERLVIAMLENVPYPNNQEHREQLLKMVKDEWERAKNAGSFAEAVAILREAYIAFFYVDEDPSPRRSFYEAVLAVMAHPEIGPLGLDLANDLLDYGPSDATGMLARAILASIPFASNQQHWQQLTREATQAVLTALIEDNYAQRVALLRAAYQAMLESVPSDQWLLDEQFCPAVQAALGGLDDERDAQLGAEMGEDLGRYGCGVEETDDVDSPTLISETPPLFDSDDELPPTAPMEDCVTGNVASTTSDVVHDKLMDDLTLVDVGVNGLPVNHLFTIQITVGTSSCTMTVNPSNMTIPMAVESGTHSPTVTTSDGTAVVHPLRMNVPGDTQLAVTVLPHCHLTCAMGDASLALTQGCITGVELLRAVHARLAAYMKLARPQRVPKLPVIEGGGQWLWLAGRLFPLNNTMKGVSFSWKEMEVLQPGKPPNGEPVKLGFDAQPFLVVGNIAVQCNLRIRNHPRVLYHGKDEKGLSYENIVNVLTKEDQAATAVHLLQVLAGKAPAKDLVHAAFLVHIFGVEAHKNNLSFATALMGLELIAEGRLGFLTLLHSFDMENLYGLSGAGGLFGMASYKTQGENATLEQIASILASKDLGLMRQIARMARHDRRFHQALVIPLKEMITIVRWCRMTSARLQVDLAARSPQQALQWIEIQVTQLLQRYYR